LNKGEIEKTKTLSSSMANIKNTQMEKSATTGRHIIVGKILFIEKINGNLKEIIYGI